MRAEESTVSTIDPVALACGACSSLLAVPGLSFLPFLPFPRLFPEDARLPRRHRGARAPHRGRCALCGWSGAGALPAPPEPSRGARSSHRFCGSGFMAQVTKTWVSIAVNREERSLLHPALSEAPLALSFPLKFLIPALTQPLRFCSPACFTPFEPEDSPACKRNDCHKRSAGCYFSCPPSECLSLFRASDHELWVALKGFLSYL